MSPSGVSSMIAMIVAGALLGRQVRCTLVGRERTGRHGDRQLWPVANESGGRSLAGDLAAHAADARLGLVFAPISVAAYKYIPVHLRAAAVGLFSLLRTEGGSVGTSLAQTIRERREQFHFSRLAESLGSLNPHVQPFLGRTRDLYYQWSGDPARSKQMGYRGTQRLAGATGYCYGFFRRLLSVCGRNGGTRILGAADEAIGRENRRAHLGGVGTTS